MRKEDLSRVVPTTQNRADVPSAAPDRAVVQGAPEAAVFWVKDLTMQLKLTDSSRRFLSNQAQAELLWYSSPPPCHCHPQAAASSPPPPTNGPQAQRLPASGAGGMGGMRDGFL